MITDENGLVKARSDIILSRQYGTFIVHREDKVDGTNKSAGTRP